MSEKRYWTVEPSHIYHLDRDCSMLQMSYNEIQEASPPLATGERECSHCGEAPQQNTQRLLSMSADEFP